ncbi:MAG: antitoxin [Microcystaceae cyanobacterium]
MNQLSKNEKEILESVEQGEWQSVESLSSEISRYQQYAQAALKKDKRVNIRISSNDLEALKFIAVDEGIPYQTLISSILHKFVTGRLIKSVD